MRNTYFHKLVLGLILFFLLQWATAVQAAGEPRAELIDDLPFLLSDAVPLAITLQDLSATSPISHSPAVIAAGLLVLSALVLSRRS